MKKILFHNKFWLSAYIVCSLLSSICATVHVLFLQWLLNTASVGESEKIKKLIAYGILICIIWAILYFLDLYLGKSYKNKCFLLLRKAYIHNLIKKKYSDITNLDSAVHISALTNNIEILNQNYFDQILYIFGNIFIIILSFFAVLYISPLITIIMCGLTLLMAVIPALLKKNMDKSNFKYSTALKRFTEKLKETLLGIEIIKSNNAEQAFEEQNNENSFNIYRKQNVVARINSIIGISSSFVNNSLIIVLVGITSYFVSDNKLMIGSTIAVMNLAMRFLGGWMSLVNQIVLASSTRSIRDELEPYLETPKNLTQSVRAKFEKGIKLFNVQFKYNLDAETNVLENINLNFEPNKKYLILGKSGSGKSTLLKLISKLEDNYTGKINIDDLDYDNITSDNINNLVSLAQQKCYLFKASLKRNIDLLETNDEKQLQYAIHAAQLTDFVSALTSGLDTLVDEEVNQVSGGEKLRINLARALYRNTPILLLDEITSAVDKITARNIEDAILQIQDKMIINVCHKFDSKTLPYYDEIIILENGRIAAQGTYDDLKDNYLLLNYQGKNKT